MVGLAKTGQAVASAVLAAGGRVTVIDDGPRTPAIAAREAEVIALGATVEISPTSDRLDALLASTDLVIPSPGIAPHHAVLRSAAARGIAIRSEIDLAASLIDAPIVAVTGTNGKTTTVEIIAALLRGLGLRVDVGGNIGTPLVSFAGTDADVMVAEVSSFQLEFTTGAWKPAVALLLNVAEDHLDWHGSFDAYQRAKFKVFGHRTGGVAILNIDDPIVAAAPIPHGESLRTVSAVVPADYEVRDERLFGRSVAYLGVAELQRSLPHDVTNALCALAAADAVCELLGRNVAHDAVVSVLKKYETLPHRVQFIGENQGVKYYNDSKATNPHAVVRAVASFDSVVLLAGGLNKGLDLGVLRGLAPHLRSVVAFGDASQEICDAFDGVRPVVAAESMYAAVRLAAHAAQEGDVVLLSPGCASFDMYPGGYPERGDDFAAEVRALITQESKS